MRSRPSGAHSRLRRCHTADAFDEYFAEVALWQLLILAREPLWVAYDNKGGIDTIVRGDLSDLVPYHTPPMAVGVRQVKELRTAQVPGQCMLSREQRADHISIWREEQDAWFD